MKRKFDVDKALEALQQLGKELDNEGASSSESDYSSFDDEVEDETFAPLPEFKDDAFAPVSCEESGDDSYDEEEIDTEARAGRPLWESKSGIAWSPTPDIRIPCRPPGIHHRGITRFAVGQIQTLEDSFDFFVTKSICEIIIQHTNTEGRRRSKSWVDIDDVELRAFLGLLILAGVYRSGGESTGSLWGDETGRPIFRATMSLKRFNELTTTLRFDDRLSRPARRVLQPDKLAPIREVWDLWVARLPLAYNPSRDICVDEQLVGFRGRCKFKQYIPSKPAKYGIKLWVVCDVASSYAWGMIPYLGKATQDAPSEKEQGKRVVLELTEGLPGRIVTTDNFFTSLSLGEELLKKKIRLVGTVRRSKPELPLQLLQTRGRAGMSSLFAFTTTTTAVSYVPKRRRNVLLLSTKHFMEEIQHKEPKKPTIILDYNSCKGAVDTLDKLVATYSCRRKTRRWPVALFSNILDVSAYNALVLWLSVEPSWNLRKKNFRRRLFLHELGSSMVRPAMARRTRLPRTSGAAALVQMHQPVEPAEPAPVRPKEKDKCRLCKRKRSVHARFCKKCGHAVCKEHSIAVCFACK